jgi:hypothetical protein
MAFGQVDPEKILGMKPEDLKSRLDASASKDDLKAITEAQTALGGSLNEIKEALKALTTKPPDPVIEEDPTDPTTAVLTDPRGFIRKETQDIQNANLDTRAQLEEMRARQNPRLAGAFQKYGDELIATAAKMNLAQRANPAFWEWHVRTILGDKVIKGEFKGDYPSMVGASSFSPGEPDASDPNKGLDPDMAAYYKKRGIPLDQAAKIMKMMNDGEPVTHAALKGSGNA